MFSFQQGLQLVKVGDFSFFVEDPSRLNAEHLMFLLDDLVSLNPGSFTFCQLSQPQAARGLYREVLNKIDPHQIGDDHSRMGIDMRRFLLPGGNKFLLIDFDNKKSIICARVEVVDITTFLKPT